MHLNSENHSSRVAPEVTDTGITQQNRFCFSCQRIDKPDFKLKLVDLKILFFQIQLKYVPKGKIYICKNCVTILNSFRWFAHQGRNNYLFHNDVSKKNLLPQPENYCRLCLSTCDQLQAIFNAQHHDISYVELINEAIQVDLNDQRDFASHVCSLCSAQLETFVTFKRIARQIQKYAHGDHAEELAAINLQFQKI